MSAKSSPQSHPCATGPSRLAELLCCSQRCGADDQSCQRGTGLNFSVLFWSTGTSLRALGRRLAFFAGEACAGECHLSTAALVCCAVASVRPGGVAPLISSLALFSFLLLLFSSCSPILFLPSREGKSCLLHSCEFYALHLFCILLGFADRCTRRHSLSRRQSVAAEAVVPDLVWCPSGPSAQPV